MARKVFAAWDCPQVEPVPLSDEILVDQEAAAETDVNRIMARLGVPGIEEMLMDHVPEDSSVVHDFERFRDKDLPAMLREVRDAHDEYDSLPAALRQSFGGLEDFVDCVCNPARLEEAVRAGIYHVDESTGEIPAPVDPLDVSRPSDTTKAKKARKKKPAVVELGNENEGGEE